LYIEMIESLDAIEGAATLVTRLDNTMRMQMMHHTMRMQMMHHRMRMQRMHHTMRMQRMHPMQSLIKETMNVPSRVDPCSVREHFSRCDS